MSAEDAADLADALRLELEEVRARSAKIETAYRFARVRAVSVLRTLNDAREDAARSRRYQLAWQNARQRADSLHQALVEADEERDYLRAQLRDRDDEVAGLVLRLAEYNGVTS